MAEAEVGRAENLHHFTGCESGVPGTSGAGSANELSTGSSTDAEESEENFEDDGQESSDENEKDMGDEVECTSGEDNATAVAGAHALVATGGVSSAAKAKRKRQPRTHFEDWQRSRLLVAFRANPFPNKADLTSIANATKLNLKVVRVWFQNRRCNEKKASISSQTFQSPEHLVRLYQVPPFLPPPPANVTDQYNEWLKYKYPVGQAPPQFLPVTTPPRYLPMEPATPDATGRPGASSSISAIAARSPVKGFHLISPPSQRPPLQPRPSPSTPSASTEFNASFTVPSTSLSTGSGCVAPAYMQAVTGTSSSEFSSAFDQATAIPVQWPPNIQQEPCSRATASRHAAAYPPPTPPEARSTHQGAARSTHQDAAGFGRFATTVPPLPPRSLHIRVSVLQNKESVRQLLEQQDADYMLQLDVSVDKLLLQDTHTMTRTSAAKPAYTQQQRPPDFQNYSRSKRRHSPDAKAGPMPSSPAPSVLSTAAPDSDSESADRHERSGVNSSSAEGSSSELEDLPCLVPIAVTSTDHGDGDGVASATGGAGIRGQPSSM